MKTSLNNPMPESTSELGPCHREPMPIESISRYLPRPETTIVGNAEKSARLLSCDIRRRELKSFFKIQQTSTFTVVDVGCGPSRSFWSIVKDVQWISNVPVWVFRVELRRGRCLRS
jgi:hypothetical protein